MRTSLGEEDTSMVCSNLNDSHFSINAFVNAALRKVRLEVAPPLEPQAVINGVYEKLGTSSMKELNRTPIEVWSYKLASGPYGIAFLPEKESTKYRDVDYFLWSIASKVGASVINPSMKVNNICIGSDKLGHFFQQGYEYYEIARRGKKGTAAAEKYGESTEIGKFGLAKTGVYSRADLEANRQGLKFYDDLAADPSLKFDIKNYINEDWSEEKLPNYYHEDVAKKVWSNLLRKIQGGSFKGPDGTIQIIELRLEASDDGTVKGSYSYKNSKGESITGLISNGKITYNKTKVAANTPDAVEAVSGITITFDWSESNNRKGKGKWTSKDEKTLEGTLTESIDLNGIWIFKIQTKPGLGDYEVRFNHQGDKVESIMLTDNEWIPAGKVNFTGKLEGKQIKGKIQHAYSGYKNPVFLDAIIEVIDSNNMVAKISDDRVYKYERK